MKVNNAESKDYKKKKIYAKRAGLSPAVLILLLGLIVTLSTGFLSCSGAGTEYSEVIINVGGGSKAVTWPPDDVISYVLTVSGSDFGTLQVVYPGGVPAVSMLVPKGTNRTIELEAYKDPTSADASAIITWRGRSTVDLESDSVQVDLPMRTGETKLVVADPDAGVSPKVFQISDISGSDWDLYLWITSNTLGGSWPGYTFLPYDLELDNRGRIYVANNGGSTNEALVWRVDSILDITAEPIIDTSDLGFTALGIDQINGYIYAATSGGSVVLYKSDLDGNGLTTLDVSSGVEGIHIISGIVVDTDGMLHIAGQNISDENKIFRYDPINERVLANFSNPNFATLFDIKVDEDYVYCANTAGSNGWGIIRISKNFNEVTGYGNYVGTEGHSPGDFYDPRRFVAITNRKITIVDDWDGGGVGAAQLDKLVSIDDMQGSGWQTFPSTDNGQVYFSFYVP